MLTKKCIVCGKEFSKPYSCGIPEWRTRRFCSRLCADKFKIGKPSWNAGIKTGIIPSTAFKKGQRPSKKTEFKKGMNPWNKGMKPTKEWYEKMIKAGFIGKKVFNELASAWKGNETGYPAKHVHLVKHFGHPQFCEHCGIKGKDIYRKDGHRYWSIDYANLSGNYLRERSDYIGLCRKCHNKFDGRT